MPERDKSPLSEQSGREYFGLARALNENVSTLPEKGLKRLSGEFYTESLGGLGVKHLTPEEVADARQRSEEFLNMPVRSFEAEQ